MDTENLHRRDVLRLGLGLVAGGPAVLAQGLAAQSDTQKYDLILPRVRFEETAPPGLPKGPDIWNVRPGGDANLLEEFSAVIRCRTKPVPDTNNWSPQYGTTDQFNEVVSFDAPMRLGEYPILFMTGENPFQFTARQQENLRAYIEHGGFLFMDDCVHAARGDYFFRSARELLRKVFGEKYVRRIPYEHEVFKNVYDLSDMTLPVIRRGMNLKGQAHGAWGVFIQNRLAVFLSPSDLHCTWCDRRGRSYGRSSYNQAIQMGINVLMYALSR